MEKQYINAQQLLDDSFALGLQILESGYVPHFIIGVWRGGTPVGITVQELLDYFGNAKGLAPLVLSHIVAQSGD